MKIEDLAYDLYEKDVNKRGHKIYFDKNSFFRLVIHNKYIKKAQVIIRRYKIKKIMNKIKNDRSKQISI